MKFKKIAAASLLSLALANPLSAQEPEIDLHIVDNPAYTNADIKVKKDFSGNSVYGFMGIIDVPSGRHYLFNPSSSDKPKANLEMGIGTETDDKKGLSLRLEAGILMPLESQKNNSPLRLSFHLNYKF